eukprot:246327_1
MRNQQNGMDDDIQDQYEFELKQQNNNNIVEGKSYSPSEGLNIENNKYKHFSGIGVNNMNLEAASVDKYGNEMEPIPHSIISHDTNQSHNKSNNNLDDSFRFNNSLNKKGKNRIKYQTMLFRTLLES